jgi:hypothetical protein
VGGKPFFEDKPAVVTVENSEIDGLPTRRSDSGKTYIIPLRQIESGEGPGFRKGTVRAGIGLIYIAVSDPFGCLEIS